MAWQPNAVSVSVLILGGAVALAGVVIIGRAIFADRSRGRRRCPRAGMRWRVCRGSGARNAGRAAKGEARLMRTRRHWGRAMAGLGVVLLGAVMGAAPMITRQDVIPYLPTSVLVFMTPTLDASGTMNAKTMEWTPQDVIGELNKRIDTRGMSAWQWRVFIEKLGVVRTRRRWPIELPLAVEMRSAWCVPGLPELSVKARLAEATMLDAERGFARPKRGEFEWRPLDRAAECPGYERIAGKLEARTRSVVFDVKLVRRAKKGGTGGSVYPRDESGREVLYEGPIRVQVGAVEGVDAAIERISSPALDAKVKGAVRVMVIPVMERNGKKHGIVLVSLDRGKLGGRRWGCDRAGALLLTQRRRDQERATGPVLHAGVPDMAGVVRGGHRRRLGGRPHRRRHHARMGSEARRPRGTRAVPVEPGAVLGRDGEIPAERGHPGEPHREPCSRKWTGGNGNKKDLGLQDSGPQDSGLRTHDLEEGIRMLDQWLLILGCAAAAFGSLVVAAALFRDRARGRRRCPRCWYDMSATPGMVCPECGKTSRREKHLFRTRRRWRLAVVGVLAALVGVGTALAPNVRTDGWLSIVPTTALMMFAPTIERQEVVDPQTNRYVEDPVAAEFRRRTKTAPLAAWQMRYLLKRIGAIKMRDACPTPVPLQLDVRVPEWLGIDHIRVRVLVIDGSGAAGEEANQWHDWFSYDKINSTGLKNIGKPRVTDVPPSTGVRYVARISEGPQIVRLEMELRHVAAMSGVGTDGSVEEVAPFARFVFEESVRGEASVDDVVPPVRSRDVDEAIKGALRVRVYAVGQFARPDLFVELDWGKLAGMKNMHVMPRFELLQDGNVVGTTAVTQAPLNLRRVLSAKPETAMRGCAMVTTGVAFGTPEIQEQVCTGDWKLRMVGAADGALTAWSRDSYWAGQVEIDLKDVFSTSWIDNQQVMQWLMYSTDMPP